VVGLGRRKGRNHGVMLQLDQDDDDEEGCRVVASVIYMVVSKGGGTWGDGGLLPLRRQHERDEGGRKLQGSGEGVRNLGSSTEPPGRREAMSDAIRRDGCGGRPAGGNIWWLQLPASGCLGGVAGAKERRKRKVGGDEWRR
jgi:hypothetical protein